MPARSKSQLRFMYAVASGKVKKKGLSATQANEWIHSTKDKSELPEKKRSKK